MLSATLLFASGLLSVITPVLAQTWTSCDPLNRTDCPSDEALGIKYSFDFTQSAWEDAWNTTAGSITSSSTYGSEFIINEKGDSPTIQSKFYIFFGTVEVWMQAASGQGIISSIVLESDDLDEVDWEFIGGNATTVETNYFGKGNTTSYDRAIYYDVNNPQGNFYNYTLYWTSEKIEWYVNKQLVRTLKYADANNGNNFPQTPMNIRLGIWAGGDSDEPTGTIEWAQGETDYDDGPFQMYVKNCTIHDFSKGKAYKYGDQTGSYDSIKIISGNSSIATTLTTSTHKKLEQKWKGLSSKAKVAIGCSCGIAGAIGIAALAFCCVRQRRIGRAERILEDSKLEKHGEELREYRQQMSHGGYSLAGGRA